MSEPENISTPQFPNYQPPNPQGVPLADPKFHKPLYKMLGMMLKPKANLLKTPFKAHRARTARRHQQQKKVRYW